MNPSMAPVRVITWNANSIKVRHERLLGVLDRHRPDVLCLQELKAMALPDALLDDLAARGYHAAVHGQKTYNGVAILSTHEPAGIIRGFEGDGGPADEQARLIMATIAGVHVYSAYFPNGGEVGSDKFTYKLAWMERLRALLHARHTPDEPLILAGDMNVAPSDADVAFPERWAQSTHCVPHVRDALRSIEAFGLRDVLHEKHPQGKVYSWWDYRQLAFPKGDGLRIDIVYATKPLADACADARVDRDERKGQGASDHAPVIADFQ